MKRFVVEIPQRSKIIKKLPAAPKTHELVMRRTFRCDDHNPRKKFTVILGATGSGKSTLLESILGQLKWSREVSMHHLMLLMSRNSLDQVQTCETISHSSVLETESQHELFNQSIGTCELTTDLLQLAAGLDTEIGEKGVNLSGGQKARVSMARAVFAARDIYIMDDPLSALDAQVGANLLQYCILGTLANTTRVLATHHVHVAAKADQVICVEAGKVVFSGTYRQYREFACQGVSEEERLDEPPTPVSKSPAASGVASPVSQLPQKQNGPSQLLTRRKLVEAFQ